MPPKAKPGKYGIQPIKVLLPEAGWTQQALADHLRCSTHMVTMVVNGQARPSLEKAAQMARVVGKPIEECFTPAMLGLVVRRRRLQS